MLVLIRYGGQLITDTNTGLTIAPRALLEILASPWTERGELGFDYTRSQSLAFPPAVIFFGLDIVGISPRFAHQVWIAGVLATAGASARYFVRCWLGERWSSTVAALGYMTSSYVILLLPDTTMFLLGYAVLPFQLGLVLRLVTEDVSRSAAARRVALLAGSFLLVSAIDIPILLINFTSVLIFACGAVLVAGQPGRRLASLGKTALGVLLGLMLLAWTLLPTATSYQAEGSMIRQNLAAETSAFYNQSTSFTEVLGLRGYWALYSGYADRPYRPYQEYYLTHPVGIVAGYALVVIAMIGFILRRRDPVALLLGLMVIATIPLVVGTYSGAETSTIGRIGTWAFREIPAASVFRDTFKFASVTTFAIVSLASAAVHYSITRARSRLVALTVIMGTLATVTAISQPLWGGRLWWSDSLIRRIPSEWFQLADWLGARPGDERVLYLPRMPRPVYAWGSPATEPGEVLIGRAQAFHMPGIQSSSGDRFLDFIYSEVERRGDDGSAIAGVLASARIKYLVIRDDARFGYYPNTSAPYDVRAVLESLPGVEFRRRFGNLTVYSLEGESVPRVGIYSRVGVAARAGSAVGWRPWDRGEVRETSVGPWLADSGGQPIVTNEAYAAVEGARTAVKRVSSTRYDLDIRQNDFWTLLVLREAYHPGWVLETDADRSRASTGAPRHLLVDGYANGWLLPPRTRAVGILYEPAGIAVTARIISGFALLVTFTLLALPYVSRRRGRRRLARSELSPRAGLGRYAVRRFSRGPREK